jgi:hypothetical protein
MLAIARGEAFREHVVDEAVARRAAAEHALERHVAGLRGVLAAAAGRPLHGPDGDALPSGPDPQLSADGTRAARPPVP